MPVDRQPRPRRAPATAAALSGGRSAPRASQSTPRTSGSATSARSPRRASAPGLVRVPARFTASKIRWDRTFRTAMLAVLVLVGWIGLHGALTLVHARGQADRELGLVSSLVAQNERLQQQATSLQQRPTIVRDARELGMVRSDEQAYVVTGLSSGN